MTIAQLNAADEPTFVAAVGPIFEHSPWIAAAAARRRPFADAAALYAAMLAVLASAPQEQKVALIAAHPDLAGRLACTGGLSAASRGEQAAAGLDDLSENERADFDALNSGYRERFGFPFVLCARDHTRTSILRELRRRAASESAAEIATALGEIEKIAWLRLRDLLAEES